MTNPLDEQQAAHVRCLQDFAAAYDTESDNGRALRAAIAALTNPLRFVEFASADALAAWLETLHETDGPAVTGNKFAPAQRAAAAIRAGDTLAAPPLCAKGATRLGRHMTGRMIEGNLEADTITFQMDRGYYMAAGAYVIEPRDDWEARTTPAQPRREVTDADTSKLIGLLEAAQCPMTSQGCDGTQYPVGDPSGNCYGEQCQWCYERRAALESFANGGDGNG